MSRLLLSLNCPPVTTSSKASWEKKKSSSHYLFILFTYQGISNKSNDYPSTTRQMRNLQPGCPNFKIKKAMTNIKILMILCNYDGSPVISNWYTLHINSNVFGSNFPLEGNNFYQMLSENEWIWRKWLTVPHKIHHTHSVSQTSVFFPWSLLSHRPHCSSRAPISFE